MKKQFEQYTSFKIIILALMVLVSLSSCEEFLDRKPTDGLVYEEYWNNKEEVESTLGGAYQFLADLDYILFLHGELRGDLLRKNGTHTGGNELAIMNSSININNKYAQWDQFYSTINICNHVIELTPGVEDQTFSDYLKQQMISEATFIRSLCYFYMVRIWKDVPYITDPTKDDEGEFFPEKMAGEEILKLVKADLIEIRNKMPEHPTIEKNKSRATAGAVNALLADICLWNFEYDECITYIEAVENSGEYFLVPAGEWFDNYNPGFTLENIFEIYYGSGNQGNTLAGNTYKSVNPKFYVSYYAEDELLSTDEASPDYEQTRGKGSISSSHQVFKYIGAVPNQTTIRSGTQTNQANFIVYRLADLYLMKAEAYSQKASPNFDEALRYLNMVRTRVNKDPYAPISSAYEFEDAILLERAKELAFEGKRWFDLLRMGRRNDYARKDALIEILIQNAPPTQQLVLQSRLSDPNGWYMPIHKNDIEKNKNLTQNSYYESN